METINEILASILVLSIAIILLTEFFYNIIRNKIRKLQGHTLQPINRVDKTREEGKKGYLVHHTGNSESRLLTFFPLLTIILTFFTEQNIIFNIRW